MLLRFGLVFLVSFLAIGANLPESVVAQMGFDPDYLKAALAAWLITALVYHRHILLIVLVLVLVGAANLPAETAAQWGVDRTITLAALVALVLMPKIVSWVEG